MILRMFVNATAILDRIVGFLQQKPALRNGKDSDRG